MQCSWVKSDTVNILGIHSELIFELKLLYKIDRGTIRAHQTSEIETLRGNSLQLETINYFHEEHLLGCSRGSKLHF